MEDKIRIYSGIATLAVLGIGGTFAYKWVSGFVDQLFSGGRTSISAEKFSQLAYPTKQQFEFVFAATGAMDSAKKADNDMARGGVLASRTAGICAALSDAPLVPNKLNKSLGEWMSNPEIAKRVETDLLPVRVGIGVAEWVGYVAKLDSNSDGKGVLEVEIGPKVILTTSNNEVSDLGLDTLLIPGTELFNVVSSLHTGEKVKFSGNLFRDPVDDMCVKEESISLNGKLMAPEFTFKFVKVEKLP